MRHVHAVYGRDENSASDENLVASSACCTTSCHRPGTVLQRPAYGRAPAMPKVDWESLAEAWGATSTPR